MRNTTEVVILGLDNNIRVFRAKFELTQQELADKVGVTRQTISAMERNTYNPSLILAFKIAEAFETTIEQVFSYEPNGKGVSK